MSQRYTDEQLSFLKEGYKQMQVPELTEAFNERFNLSKTEGQVRAALKNHKFSCGRPTGSPKGTFREFTQEQADFIRENYTRLSIADLTASLNTQFKTDKTHQQVRSFTRNHKYRSGRTGQFEAGMNPWNEGTKGLVKPNAGNFEKGHIPVNIKPIGHERICSKDGFILIKVAEPNPYTGAPTRYRHKHVWLWEQAYGPVPKGRVVAFIDGDKLHCVADNLMLLTRAEVLRLNNHKYGEAPDELKPTILSLAKVEAKTFAAMREIQNKK